jgi:phosphatidylserine/phosphatidylglycerophosphate/cardiolipin synthase-like enzyme
MTPQELDAWLLRSFEDRHLSRGERQALGEFAAALGSGTDREVLRRKAFAAASAALAHPDARSVLDWLEDVVKVLREPASATDSRGVAEAYFSPGEECPRTIGRLLARASRRADVCVFTITDDRLADALLDAHRRGVAVRIITDDAKVEDLGSDVERFEREGLAVRVDRSPFHMHHKFAIVDGGTLLTGSYNWTRGAARDNEENLIVTDDARLLAAFTTRFDRLWDRLG